MRQAFGNGLELLILPERVRVERGQFFANEVTTDFRFCKNHLTRPSIYNPNAGICLAFINSPAQQFFNNRTQ